MNELNRPVLYYRLINGDGGVIIGGDGDTIEDLWKELLIRYGNRLVLE